MTVSADVPPLFAEFPLNVVLRLTAPDDIRPSAAQRAAFLKFTQVDDPVADAVVTMFRRLPTGEGRRMFELAVEQGIDAVANPPHELVAFFEHVESTPYWVDPALLARASQVSGRIGVLAGFTSLSMFALMGGYLASRADKALVGTGNLERMTAKRLAETSQWVVDISVPGGLDRRATGFKGILRVRLMHAMVRSAMNARPDWDYQNWDRPINQSQTVGTLLMFSLATLTGAQSLGISLSKADRAAVFHFWRYVGYLLGIHPDLLPTCERDAWRLMWLEAEYEFRPDADSRRLAQALAKSIGPLVVGNRPEMQYDLARKIAAGYLLAYSRLILGGNNADALGLPNNPIYAAAVIATAAANFAVDKPLSLIPGGSWLSSQLGLRGITRLTRQMSRVHRGDRRGPQDLDS